jgi:hypothetical protein
MLSFVVLSVMVTNEAPKFIYSPLVTVLTIVQRVILPNVILHIVILPIAILTNVYLPNVILPNVILANFTLQNVILINVILTNVVFRLCLCVGTQMLDPKNRRSFVGALTFGTMTLSKMPLSRIHGH